MHFSAWGALQFSSATGLILATYHPSRASISCKLLDISAQALIYIPLKIESIFCSITFLIGFWTLRQFYRPKDMKRAKYELQYSQRSTYAADQASFACMGVRQDVDGNQGVYLQKDIVQVASTALSKHVKTVAPKILTIPQLASPLSVGAIPPYLPRPLTFVPSLTTSTIAFKANKTMSALSPGTWLPSIFAMSPFYIR